jgi:hypothetical protein
MPKTKVNQMPPVGSIFHRTFNRKIHELTIVATERGGVAFMVNGNVFNTPTAAAKSITRYEVNGWVFCKLGKCVEPKKQTGIH